ncbi:MAG: hypothetical protein M1546_11390 [Chloroflexi bacterium]|nr:hypothetical protein [Chloroflexota bacterium]
MKTEGAGSRWRWLLLLVPLSVIVTLLIALTVQGVVRQVIIPPLSYALWLADLVIRSVAQSTFWTILVAVGFLVAVRSLFGGWRKGVLMRHVVPAVGDRPEPSRLQQRLHDLQQLNESTFAREKVSFELRRITLDLLAYQEHQDPAEIERRVRSGALTIPSEIRALLLSWQTWLADPEVPAVPLPGGHRGPFWQRLWPRWLLRRHNSRNRRQPGQPSLYERKVARVIDYMDEQLGSQIGGQYAIPLGDKPPEDQHA